MPEAAAIKWVPQGGASGEAEVGVAMLADELAADLGDAPTTVVVPAGTGTTALFLARRLSEIAPRVDVRCVPCATSKAELLRQLQALDAATGAVGALPRVLDADPRPDEPRHRFGAPAKRDLETWTELQRAGLHVDLVYAPHAFDTMLRALDAGGALEGRRACYVHCGGVEGVATQLNRYRHAGLLPDSEDPRGEHILGIS